jgi:hypothetical protein
LLESYGVSLNQPEAIDEKGYVGRLKVLAGDFVTKVAELVSLLTGYRGMYKNEAVLFENLSLFISPQNTDFEKISFYKMKGFEVVTLSGSFLRDARKILKVLSIPCEKVRLVVMEPPGTFGKRSKFSINGLMIHAKSKDWFMVDSVEKVEEIPYLRSRGVNLIFY